MKMENRNEITINGETYVKKSSIEATKKSKAV